MLNNKNIKVYTVYNDDNTIKERYVRKPSPLDSQEVIKHEAFLVAPSQNKPDDTTLPTYFGEWEKVPQEEIDRLNQERLVQNKVKPTKQPTHYDEQRKLKIKQAEELLASLQAELKSRTKEGK